MNVSIIGSGYVGSVTGAGLADLGNQVTLVDIDNEKVKKINSGASPIFEPGLPELIQKNKKRLKATTDFYSAVQNSDITFICVGTPSNEDGSIDLTFVESAADTIGLALKRKETFHTVVVKSTVFPGTVESLVKPVIKKASGKKYAQDFCVAFNPEFLREGSAIHDFTDPDRIIIGVENRQSEEILQQIYHHFTCPKLITDIKTAEMIKYASNAFLAVKISYANEIGNVCKVLNIDSAEVFKGVGLDKRINPSFFGTGIGFGGSCFPKDLKAFIASAKNLGLDTKILQSVVEVNEEQPLKVISLLKKHLPDLQGVHVGVLGLAFKPGTDDIRESRAIPIIESLLQQGVTIRAYDPKAMDNFRMQFPMITYCPSAEEVLDCDALLILTEWEEFKNVDYTGKLVIDGRRIENAKKNASVYEGVCW